MRRRLGLFNWVWGGIYWAIVYALGSHNGPGQFVLGIVGGFVVGAFLTERSN